MATIKKKASSSSGFSMPSVHSSSTGEQASATFPAAGSGGGAEVGTDVFEVAIQAKAAELSEALAAAFIEIVREEAPLGETGHLRESVHLEGTVERSRDVVSNVIVDAEYAQYVIDGTMQDADEEGYIRPVNKLALAFEWGGEYIVVARAKAHEPNDFWQRALDRWDEVVGSV